MDPLPEVGTTVTRDGSDRWRVVDYNFYKDLVELECLVVPVNGPYSVGEREWTLSHQCHLVAESSAGLPLP